MNALAKMMRKPSDLETARQALADAEADLARSKDKLAQYEEARKRYATDQALGSNDAGAALDRVNAEMAQERITRDNIAASLEGLRQRVQEAAGSEADAERARDLKELKTLLTRRVDLGHEWDMWCQEAMRIVNKMETAGDQIERLMSRLTGRKFEAGLMGPLGSPVSIHGRMMQVATMAGLGRVLDFYASDLDPKFANRTMAEREAILKLRYLKTLGLE